MKVNMIHKILISCAIIFNAHADEFKSVDIKLRDGILLKAVREIGADKKLYWIIELSNPDQINAIDYISLSIYDSNDSSVADVFVDKRIVSKGDGKKIGIYQIRLYDSYIKNSEISIGTNDNKGENNTNKILFRFESLIEDK